MFGQLRQECRLPCHHVAIEIGRAPHGLAGVVDDEIEPVEFAEQLRAECFDARRVAEVESEDLEAITPFGKVGLAGVTRRRVARETPWVTMRRAPARKSLMPAW